MSAPLPMAETRRCSKCKIEKNLSQFRKVGGVFKHLRADCNKCVSERNSKVRTDRENKIRTKFSELGCCVCGVTNSLVLEVHHLAKEYKRYKRGQSATYNLEDIENNLAVVLCANDHSLFHGHFGGNNAPFPPQTKESVIKICLLERGKGGL